MGAQNQMPATIVTDTTRDPGRKSTARPIGPVLVATDGLEASDGAFAAAHLLDLHRGAEVRVFSVLEPLPLVAPDMAALAYAPEVEEARRSDLNDRVQRQLRRSVPAGANWQIEFELGQPAPVIARAARGGKVGLLLTGLRRHGMVDRAIHGETVLQLLRLTDVPVLAVAPGFTALPGRVIIATDFSDVSLRAARAALPIMRENAMIYLVHVVPRQVAWNVSPTYEEAYRASLGQAFDEFVAALQAPADALVEPITLYGDPATEILAMAKAADVDLIVTGTQGRGAFARLLLGSVATGLVHGAPCSLLVAPPTSVREEPVSPGASRRGLVAVPQKEWQKRLAAFTERHAGRRSMIEIDDPDLGAQSQALDYPFLGVDYDHKDGRVEIMLGDAEAGKRHLTRSIGDVSAVEIMEGTRGVDDVLRIAHGAGQTLLRFPR